MNVIKWAGPLILFVFLAAGPVHGAEQICSSSAVIFCDDFESADLTTNLNKRPGWDIASGCAPGCSGFGLASDQAFQGTKSLKMVYPAGDGGAAFGNQYFPAVSGPIYVRYYSRWSANWVWSGVATKSSLIVAQGSDWQWYLFNDLWGQGRLPSVMRNNVGSEVPGTCEGVPPGAIDTVNCYPNVGARINFQGERWYCMEAEVIPNTLGQANGRYRAWIDGALVADHSGLLMRTTNTGITQFMLSGYWNSGANTHPTMARWTDNIVISTQRIGCLSGTPATPPSPPTGLRVE